jgi:hypothetical protein
VEGEAASRRDSFDLFGKRFEIDLLLFELSDETNNIGQIPSKPVKSPDAIERTLLCWGGSEIQL